MTATETMGPFDLTPWAQDQWYRYAAVWVPSGVLDAPAASASAGSLGLTFNGLIPTLSAGRAWVRGGGYELSGGSKTLTAVAANTNASLQRRDRIVLRRDLAAKTIALVQLQGTPASSPAAPALQQSETGQWDLPLFSFLVPPNSGTAITGVVDERGFVSPRSATVAFAASAARDAYFPAPQQGDQCTVAAVPQIYDGAGWQLVRAAAWTALAAGGSGYNQPASASWVDLPGMSGSVAIPPGRLLDVKFTAPTVNVPPAGGISLRCVVNGVAGPTTTYQANSSNPGYAVPGLAEYLSYLGTGAAVTISAQVIGAAGGGYVQGDGYTGPALTYRIN